ncbi:endonuclease/exonuclease/phosphatase family protein [Rhizoctonia solani AG-3 Rhs1AP]|uniref:Endonuclease/exonuclease/phosphatase family protein n=2 Tax=Rhizoctonia solani AG-3 TaxID=1086053 RepID=A0A074RQ23_9AGAM|nr:endonuclease/exonuclease/phosphatase family protein [Rhizoctonia solani AG-3 Rhs1AP]KEP48974.1 endonuclease/exonuclease/phosphatase family protein [Rhizoctonia solani 123E]
MLHRSIVLLAASAISSAAGATNGIFNVISLEVNGYQAALERCGLTDSDKMRNMNHIGLAIAENDYDIINVQEDFHYHEWLIKGLTQQFRTETSGDVPSGSGLNTFSKYDWVDFSRNKWDSCGNACSSALGFTFMRVRIDKGVYIDMINLDVNRFNDQKATSLNIKQLSEFIRTESDGNAIIIFGNTGSLYTRNDDNLETVALEHDLKDAWVEAIGDRGSAYSMAMCPGGAPLDLLCESEQKILYRGSRAINLKAHGFYYDTLRFKSPEGYFLSGQYPVRAAFEWSLYPSVGQSKPYGGSDGKRFSDMAYFLEPLRVESITLRGANRLDGLTIAYPGINARTHGGSGGKAYTISLDPGEFIAAVEVCWGEKDNHTSIFYAGVTTSSYKFVEAGKMTDRCRLVSVPQGYALAGTYGRDGKEINQLGFIYAKRP